jgi:hypothetical protein
MLLVLFSCSERKPPAPLTSVDEKTQVAGSSEVSSTQISTSAASSTTSQTSNEMAITPAMITGVFLACDFQPPPATGATTAKLGCRMADKDTAAKHDMSQYSQYTWGFETLNTGFAVNVTLATSPGDPWHVYYDISNRADTLHTVKDALKVGLKQKDDSATYYQKVGDVTGKLGLLLNGTWTSACLLESTGTYVKTTETYKDNTYTTRNEYSDNSTCNSPNIISDVTGSFLSLIYNGMGFIADLKYISLKFMPRDAKGLATVQQMCPGTNFQLNVATEAISCTNPDSRNYYTTLKLDDKAEPQRLYWAVEDSQNTALTPELRATDFSTADPQIKQ